MDETTPQSLCPQKKTCWWKTSSVLPTQQGLTLSLTWVSQPVSWVFSPRPISRCLPPGAAMEGSWIWKVETVLKPRAGNHRKTGVPWIPGKNFYPFVSPTSRRSQILASGCVPKTAIWQSQQKCWILQDGFQLSLMGDLPSEDTRTCSCAWSLTHLEDHLKRGLLEMPHHRLPRHLTGLQLGLELKGFLSIRLAMVSVS